MGGAAEHRHRQPLLVGVGFGTVLAPLAWRAPRESGWLLAVRVLSDATDGWFMDGPFARGARQPPVPGRCHRCLLLAAVGGDGGEGPVWRLADPGHRSVVREPLVGSDPRTHRSCCPGTGPACRAGPDRRRGKPGRSVRHRQRPRRRIAGVVPAGRARRAGGDRRHRRTRRATGRTGPAAMTRVAAGHQAAGDTAEAQRWKQMGHAAMQRSPAHARPQPRQATGQPAPPLWCSNKPTAADA